MILIFIRLFIVQVLVPLKHIATLLVLVEQALGVLVDCVLFRLTPADRAVVELVNILAHD